MKANRGISKFITGLLRRHQRPEHLGAYAARADAPTPRCAIHNQLTIASTANGAARTTRG